MASSKLLQHNYFKEKLVLQEEEKILKEMLGKFQDQLNRLKIEELALMSLLKMQEQQGETNPKTAPVKSSAGSLDSISDTASITSVALVGLMYENAAEVNKEYLDLNVNGQNITDETWQHEFEEEDDDDDDNKNGDDQREICDDSFTELENYLDFS